MTLQSSGAISINDIVGEFGGTAPHGLTEYYGAAPGIPTSGAISIGDFYGASNGPSSIALLSSVASKVISSSAIAGDICVTYQTSSRTDNPNGYPTGFTAIGTLAMGSGDVTMAYKILDGSEAGTSWTGGIGGPYVFSATAVFRPNVPANTVTLVSGTSTAASLVIPNSGKTPPLISVVTAAKVASYPTSTNMTRFKTSNVHIYYTSVFYKIFNTAPANTNIANTNYTVYGILQIT